MEHLSNALYKICPYPFRDMTVYFILCKLMKNIITPNGDYLKVIKSIMLYT